MSIFSNDNSTDTEGTNFGQIDLSSKFCFIISWIALDKLFKGMFFSL